MNIILSVIPGVDLALARQIHQALIVEHDQAYEYAFLGPGLYDWRSQEASFNLFVKEARMEKVCAATVKARSN